MGDQMTTHEVVAGLDRERRRLLAAVDAMGDRAGTVSVTEPDGWTAKDVLGHLIHSSGQVAFGLGAPETPPPYVLEVSSVLTGQEWNDRSVTYWRAHDLVGVRTEFARITDVIMEHASRLTDEQMNTAGTISWAGDRTLWHFIGADTFLHEWPAHAAQIEAAHVRGVG